jgi:hypothetical protein
MASEIEVSKASAADLAADMEYHRATWSRFFRGGFYAAAALAVLLLILFLTLN